MIGTLYKRNSCVTLHPPGSHYSRSMSKSTETRSVSISNSNKEHRNSNPNINIKRCHSSSKVEKPQSTSATLKERINGDLKNVAENLCLIESLIPCIRNEADSQELVKQLRDTNKTLQQILPTLHIFMTLPVPVAKEEKERYQLEKKQLSREFEAAILSYKNSHKTLNAAVKRVKNNVAL